MATTSHEGSLQAPTRHPLDWKQAFFYDEDLLYEELERVYDICHGCRRCVSLCNAFPVLFDLIDESETWEVDGVAKQDYWKVIDHCYLCDLCYMTKCPYVPPHEWNVDFPHLMLRAKAVKFKQQGAGFRDTLLTNTDSMGKLLSKPIVAPLVNTANKLKPLRMILEKSLGISARASLPIYHSQTIRKSLTNHSPTSTFTKGATTMGKVVVFATCYGNYNAPELGKDLFAVFEHNDIAVKLVEKEQCCGMPKLELGDLGAVEKAMQANIPQLVKLVEDGWDIVAPVPSCVLMFKQEIPLMYPDDQNVQKVANAIFDPFEYLMLRYKEGYLKTEFKNSLGKVAYHVACHQRVQNIGMKTRDILQLVPDTEVNAIERCSGHDGTYAVKVEFHDISMKIAKPVINQVKQLEADYYSSDCPMAGHQIKLGLASGQVPTHPLSLLRHAYGI